MSAGQMIVDHTKIGAAFRRLSLPVAIQILGDQLLGAVDTIAIGSLGTVALAGATAANTVFVAIAFTSFGFMSGTSIVAAQRIGAGDVEGFASTVRAGALVPVLLGVLCFGASLYASSPVIHALIGALPSAPASAVYLTLRCASIIPIVISGTLIVGLGAAGNQRLGILVLAVVNLVHIPLLMLLGLGWWTHHPFGIVGAGISSLLSETIAAIIAIVYVARRPLYRIFSNFGLSWPLARRCAQLGLPEAIFLLGVTAPDIFIVAMLAPLGAMAVAAFRALNVVSDLTFVVPSPLQNATQIVIGQRLGARDPDGARWFFERALRVSLVVTTITGAVTAALAWPLAFIFTLNATVASLAALPLALHMITLPLKGWAMVSLAPIRASGDTKFSMTVGILCSALVIPLAWIGIEKLHLGLYSVALGWIAAWTVRALLTQWKLRDGAWMRRAPLAA
ncbi:MAG TPA: MATE family efflux transporter [Candidatus Acidoferrales bacterium]|jgi:MATE family multidrug resistance protein|nr:MATE family efflux transporter [Candidatus Acidoferrales bacterium]